MESGDFFANEKSVVIEADTTARIEFVDEKGETTVLKKGIKLTKDEVMDSTFMDAAKLQAFFEKEIDECKKQDILLSLHLKATMMKVSDPIMFGYCVKVFFKDVFSKHAATFKEIGVNANNGFGDVLKKLDSLPEAKKAEIEKDIEACYAARPKLAMVNSDKGITNLHVPSDIIIDASMPAMIRSSGQMWNAQGELQDTLAVIPDSSYAGVYEATIDFCRKNGAFDPRTMGTVPNVGLMAQKAEEYGSHDKTFQATRD